MKRKICLMIAFLNGCILKADFYYPVAALRNTHETLLCLRQQAGRTTSLHSYQLSTQTSTPLLPEIFNPKEVKLIPDESGFSFIDNGRLRIKYFNKRWPHSCEFDIPIHTIQWIRWLTSEYYLFNAHYNNRFGVFLGTRDDCCIPLYHTQKADCIFPIGLDNNLFFVMKDTQGRYAIGLAPMPSLEICKEALYSIDLYNKKEPLVAQCHKIIEYQEPIAFLTMINATQGFFIAYPQKAWGAAVEFECIQFQKYENCWKTEFLFSFSIPLSYLNPAHEDYLVESLQPVMPQYDNNTILFLDADGSNTLHLYKFNLATHFKVPLIPHVLNNKRFIQSYIRPLSISNDTIICGYKG